MTMQLDLPIVTPRRQSTARAAGEAAGDACLKKAGRVADFDIEGAAQFILGYLARHGDTSGEHLVDQATAHGFRAHDARAFGPVFARLSKRGHIRCVGYCLRTKGHAGAGGRVWGRVR